MSKVNKYLYGLKLMVNYGQKWEFECFYDRNKKGSRKEAHTDLKAYRENCNYPVKLSYGRMKNPAYREE